ncbi:MAG: MFS transporter [Acidimicrobiia bacterium]|nr:MFS transporter [Acidimicrobiia bacterium]
MSDDTTRVATKQPLERHHVFLLAVLGVASFFDGYDMALKAILLPDLGHDFGLTSAEKSVMLGTIFLGAVPALFLSRRADQFGRRRVLFISLIGYTIFSGLTALSTGATMFAVLQFLSLFFVMTESAVASVMIAESLPASRRGFGFGVLAMLTGVGTGVAAILNSVFGLLEISWEWLYVCSVPLLVGVLFLRRNLPESKRFEQAKADGHLARHWTTILRPPHRKWLITICTVAFLSSLTTYAVEFVVDFLQNERGMTKAASTGLLVAAGLPAIAMMVVAGALSDRVGRKLIGCAGAAVGVVGGVLFYNLHLSFWPMLVLISFTTVGFAIAWPTISVFNAELFPTALRSQAGSWATLMRTLGQAASLFGGALLVHVLGGVPITVTILAIGPVLMIVIVVAMFPNTHGRELEDLSVDVHEEPPATAADVLDVSDAALAAEVPMLETEP